jgi:hypothetical protein
MARNGLSLRAGEEYGSALDSQLDTTIDQKHVTAPKSVLGSFGHFSRASALAGGVDEKKAAEPSQELNPLKVPSVSLRLH